MLRLLITAFGPYDRWPENSSWLALVELTQDLPSGVEITTRRYPVDFEQVERRLREDLEADYDFALHLGQSPGSANVQLEAIAVNVGGESDLLPEQHRELAAGGPVAYRSSLPLAAWSEKLRAAQIPAQVSYHAGTYLCNATLYWSHWYAEQMSLTTKSAFLHLPLDTSQVLDQRRSLASLPAAISAQAVRLLVEELISR